MTAKPSHPTDELVRQLDTISRLTTDEHERSVTSRAANVVRSLREQNDKLIASVDELTTANSALRNRDEALQAEIAAQARDANEGARATAYLARIILLNPNLVMPEAPQPD